jgi:hypothetical protein
VLHEHETTLSAASHANRSRCLAKCAKESARYLGASFHQGAQSFAGCDFWAKLGGQVMAAAPILSEIRS